MGPWRTVGGEYHNLALQARMPDPSRVINIPCPGIVERVEAGIFDDDAYDDLFDRYLAPYDALLLSS